MNSVRRERATARRPVASMVALSVGAVLALSTAGPALAVEGEAPQERVLQSVDVQMAPDGTLTTIDGTIVQSSGGSEDADTSESEYAPDEVAPALPVRVMTAWRTEDGVGTDLADLDGYDGEIRIDLTVQNLTVKPQNLTYDVEGQSRQQAALVGSPLTVVAAADLGELPADSVVTAGQGPTTDATNGVLGKDQGGQTQVQWATILAPPQLGASARFSLVVDAKDFEVPDLDISVQPGLVTDPSLGALVDSAFNPQASQETRLQQDTIALIGDVNAVLARAGGTISEVRQILSGSAETLGDKTVADLQSSTQSIASSMDGLSSTLRGLQQQVSSSLEATGSSSLAELEQAVQTVDSMLGDTNAKPPVVGSTGNGCQTRVARPGDASSVYGNLLQVAGQLTAYANATAECKDDLKETILTTIGPDEPSVEKCVDSESVTCSLYGAQTTYTQVAEDLRDATGQALDLLEPELYEQALAASAVVTDRAGRIAGITDQLNSGRIFVTNVLRETEYWLRDYSPDRSDDTLGELDRQLQVVRSSLSAINADAVTVQDSLTGAQGQVAQIGTDLCVLNATLDPAQQAVLKKALATLRGTDCDDDEIPGKPTPSLQERNFDSAATLAGEIVDASAPDSDAVAALEDIEAKRLQLRDLVVEAINYRKNPSDPSLGQLQAELTRVLYGDDSTEPPTDGLYDALDDFEDAVRGLEDKAEESEELDIEKTINDLIDQTESDLQSAIEKDITQVGRSRDLTTEQLNMMFELSSQGMRTAAGDVVRNGKEALDEQKAEFARAQAGAARRISSDIGEGLDSISQGVNASSRDIEASGSLLTADLRKVLLDLGQREVNGGGLLGAMTTSAQTAKGADVQLANATSQTSAYSNVRRADIAGILLRQAQAKAAMEMLAEMPAFELDLSAGTLHRTVYNYRIGDGQ
jgi:trimeric autotransporter adhesin